MTLSLNKIHQAHQQYTGVDFPKLFKAFKDMGIIVNTVNIEQGETSYIHQDGAEITDESVKVAHCTTDTPCVGKRYIAASSSR